MILEGQITNGMGRAKKFIAMMTEPFYKKTGIMLFPGTLNVKLINSYNLSIDYMIKAKEYGGDFNVQIQKCKVLQENAYIVRSEKNINNTGDYKQNIIEIVSSVNFREKYDLKDGDLIKIEISDKL